MRVIFADGTKSHLAVRAVVVADTRGQLRVLDMDTVAELVDMLEWWRRVPLPSGDARSPRWGSVRETPVAVCAVSASKRVG